MFYKFLKWIAKIALKVFFKKIHFTSLSEIPKNSPLIVVSNHPNTFMDAILVASLINREFYFLTNASVFTNSFIKWFLKKLHMIPIYRKQDVKEGNPDNTDAFKECILHLKNQGALMIFPEGVSESKRQLKKFKTGTARIALLAEESSNFSLELIILPIGINYSEPENFRSNALIITGNPIYVKDFKEVYLSNPQDAVNRLTDSIYYSVQQLVIDTQSDYEDELIKNIQTLFVNQYGLSHNSVYGIFTIEKKIQSAIQYFSVQKPFDWHELTTELKAYFYTLGKYEFDDYTISNANSLKKLYRISLVEFILLLILLPLFVLGWFTNWVPYTLPKLVATKMTPYKEYHAGIKLITGLIVFPVWYFLSYLWLGFLFHNEIQTLWIFILFPILGFFSLNFSFKWQEVQKKLKLVYEFKRNKRKITELKIQRKNLISKLLKLQMEYQNYQSEMISN